MKIELPIIKTITPKSQIKPDLIPELLKRAFRIVPYFSQGWESWRTTRARAKIASREEIFPSTRRVSSREQFSRALT